MSWTKQSTGGVDREQEEVIDNTGVFSDVIITGRCYECNKITSIDVVRADKTEKKYTYKKDIKPFKYIGKFRGVEIEKSGEFKEINTLYFIFEKDDNTILKMTRAEARNTVFREVDCKLTKNAMTALMIGRKHGIPDAVSIAEISSYMERKGEQKGERKGGKTCKRMRGYHRNKRRLLSVRNKRGATATHRNKRTRPRNKKR